MQDFFKKCFYINRKDRTDRRETFENQLKSLGLFDWAIRYEAVDKTTVEKEFPNKSDYDRSQTACGSSHKNIIKIAKENNFENVLIFEDDALFLENFNEVIKKSIEQSKELNWDLFYLSCNLFDNPINFISENLINISSCYCTHAYCVNKSAYDKFLSYDPTTQPVDVFLLHNEFKRIGSYPLCVSVYASNSDIISGYASYDSLFRSSYEKNK